MSYASAQALADHLKVAHAKDVVRADEIPFLGFLDDATVVAFAVTKTRGVLDDFMIWETTAP